MARAVRAGDNPSLNNLLREVDQFTVIIYATDGNGILRPSLAEESKEHVKDLIRSAYAAGRLHRKPEHE